MDEGKTQKELIAALLKERSPLSPSEIAEATGINPGVVRTLVRQMLHQGMIEQYTYGMYRAPQEKPPKLDTRETSHNGNNALDHEKSSQSNKPKRAADDVREGVPYTKKEDSTMRANHVVGSSPKIRIPEYLNITLLGEVIARLEISEIVKGLVKNVDITRNLFEAGFSDKEEPSPDDE